MSVYKEGYMIVNEIQKRSKQIWNDSADYGALTQVGDQLWLMVKQLIAWYGLPETKKVVKYGKHKEMVDMEITVELMDEWNTGRIEPFKITYLTIKSKINGVYWDGLFGVEKRPSREPEKMKCTCHEHKPGKQTPHYDPECEIHGVMEHA